MSPTPSRWKVWVYVVCGALLLPFLIFFAAGFLGIRLEIPPAAPALAGGALGWLIWRMLARRS